MGVLRKVWNHLVASPVVSGMATGAAYAAHAAFSGRMGKHLAQGVELGRQSASLANAMYSALVAFQDPLIGIALAAPAAALFEILKKYSYKTDYFTPSKIFGSEQSLKTKRTAFSLEKTIKSYAKIFGSAGTLALSSDWQKRIAMSEKILSENPRHFDSHAILIEAYSKIGDYENACIASRNLAEMVSQGLADPHVGGTGALAYAFKTKALPDRIIGANLEIAQGDHHSAIKHFIEIAKEGIEFKVLAANAISSIAKLPNYSKKCSIEAAELWKDAIEELAPQLSSQDRLGESKNLVYELKNNKFLGSTIIFKAKKSREELVQEKSATETIEKIVAAEKNCFVPIPLHITEKQINIRGENLHVYASRIESGSTLLQQINAGRQTISDFFKIAGCLALIHAKFPAEKTYGKLPIAATLFFGKLRSSDFAVPAKLQKEIMKNYRPVYDSIVSQNFVYNKDAHPENWLIDDSSNITALDCEKGWLVPQQFDLANLLDYGNYLSYAQKKQIIFGAYLPAYGKETNSRIDEKKFITGYLNSVVHRALSLSSAWSSKDRQSLKPKRKFLIDNAIQSICNVAKEDMFYYGSYALNYTRLMQALSELSAHLGR